MTLHSQRSRIAACHDVRMSAVDADDDTIARWVVHHYRYDPARHQRRNVIVAAFDNEQEFDLELKTRSAGLRAEQAAGARSDREQISGTVLPAGYLAAAARGHAVRKAVQHGAAIRIQSKELPKSLAFLRNADEG
jgi:hypothetical protein